MADTSRPAKSTRRRLSRLLTCTPDSVSTFQVRSLLQPIDPVSPETLSIITADSRLAAAQSSLMSRLQQQRSAQLDSELLALAQTASTAPSTPPSGATSSVIFAPDGSRFLRRASLSQKDSTSRRSRWVSRFVPLNPLGSFFNKRVEFCGRLKASPYLSFSITPATATDSDYLHRLDRGAYLGWMRYLTHASLSIAFESARSVSQRTPLGLWSVDRAATDLRPDLARLWKKRASSKNSKSPRSKNSSSSGRGKRKA